MTEIKKIEGIQDPVFGQHFFFYKDNEMLVRINNSSLEIKRVKHERIPFVLVACKGDSILVRDQSRLTWYDHNLNETQSIEWIMKGRTQTKLLHEDFLIFRNSVNDTDWNLFGFDLSKNQINWTLSNDRSHFVQLDYPFFYQCNNKAPKTITCRSVLTGSEVWSCNLRDEEILSKLVVGNGQLLIPTLSGKILSLNCRTGEQQWSIKAYPYPKLDELAKRFFTIQARLGNAHVRGTGV